MLWFKKSHPKLKVIVTETYRGEKTMLAMRYLELGDGPLNVPGMQIDVQVLP